MYRMVYVVINGKTLPAENAFISVQDRGFRYGDGAFETIAVHGGKPSRLEWHINRLSQGLKAIHIRFDTAMLPDSCHRLLQANQVREGLLRIQVTRGIGGRGYLPEMAEPTYVIETLPLPEIPKQPVSLWLSSYQRTPSALSRYKLCQGLNSTLARMEAAEHNCFDALMLSEDGFISETSSANIFWVKDHTLYTPSLDCGCVEGAMRAAIIEQPPYPLKEIKARIEVLQNADAVFITNVAWKALPVSELKPAGMRWDSRAVKNL